MSWNGLSFLWQVNAQMDGAASQVDSRQPQFGLLPTYQPMVLILAAVIFGLGVDRLFDLPCMVYCCGLFLALVCLGVASYSLARKSVFRTVTLSLILYLGVASVAGFWHHVRWNWVGENDIATIATDVPLSSLLARNRTFRTAMDGNGSGEG